MTFCVVLCMLLLVVAEAGLLAPNIKGLFVVCLFGFFFFFFSFFLSSNRCFAAAIRSMSFRTFEIVLAKDSCSCVPGRINRRDVDFFFFFFCFFFCFLSLCACLHSIICLIC
jgi:hypothetical protein